MLETYWKLVCATWNSDALLHKKVGQNEAKIEPPKQGAKSMMIVTITHHSVSKTKPSSCSGTNKERGNKRFRPAETSRGRFF